MVELEVVTIDHEVEAATESLRADLASRWAERLDWLWSQDAVGLAKLDALLAHGRSRDLVCAMRDSPTLTVQVAKLAQLALDELLVRGHDEE